MVYVLVFLSGAAALIYEVIWGRQLSTFLGITTYAHTIVIACFMAGLAIGSWLLGRRADRVRDPLLLFARLEDGIGLFGLSTLALVPILQKLYVIIAPQSPSGWISHGVRLTVAAGILLPPTILMGGTLPALVRGLRTQPGPLGSTVAALYGLNTLGAAAGALVSGYSLLPNLGSWRSLVVAIALNFTVALGVVARRAFARPDRRDSSNAPEPPPLLEEPLSEIRRTLLLAGFGLSGVAALALQLAWIRALTQVIGSSVYAFGLTTASYLLGLACGSLLATLATGILARRRATIRAAVVLEGATGLAVVAGIPILGRLPELFLAGYRLGVHESFPRLQLFAFVLASSVLVVPTLFLGAVYPLIASRLPRRARETGRGLGSALAANSLGTVVGTLAAGLVLLPLLGANGLLRAAAILCLGIAALWHLVDSPLRPIRSLATLAALAALSSVALTVPPWDPALMTSGPFINAARFVDVPAGRPLRTWLRNRSRILYHREGLEAAVSVRDVDNERLLVINGKTDGSRHGDRRTQLILSHLPLLSHPQPKRVLLIGLGTGMSAAAVAAHADVEKLTIAEISAEVIEASQLFLEENESVLEDPRVELERADARNLLLTSNTPFDVIVSEPSNPWITGVANLFTREFFTLARDRLSSDGVMVQWFQTYGMSEQDFRSVLRSFADAFPQVTVWSPQLGDLLFLGSLEPRPLSLDRFGRLLSTARGRAQLESIDLLDTAALARLFLLDDPGVRRLVAGARANTDDHPRVEFNAPRSLYSETTLGNLTAAIDHLDGRTLVVPLADLGSYRVAESSTTIFEAIGLSVELTAGMHARGEWRVNWTPLIGAEQFLEPVAVGNRPAIVLEVDSARIEIERGFEEIPLTPSLLHDRLRVRTPGTETRTGELRLQSGEPAVWIARRQSAGENHAMAWSCGFKAGRSSRFIAIVDSHGETIEDLLSRIAGSLRCSYQDE